MNALLFIIFCLSAILSVVVNLDLGYYGIFNYYDPPKNWDPARKQLFYRERRKVYPRSIILFIACTLSFSIWIAQNTSLNGMFTGIYLAAAKMTFLLSIVCLILIIPTFAGKEKRYKEQKEDSTIKA